MDTFTAKAASATAKALSPSKHVNYTQGMVLGVDDFMQEFAFHNGRNEWLLRDLVGYGTASGLRVSYDDTGGKHEVRVTGGTAVSPRGQMIRVCCDQCADLAVWLKQKEHQDEVTKRMTSPLAGSISLYVALCFRECPADNVPIPGEPCRSEDDSMAPSRLTDDFKIELRYERPEQKEEEVLRRMVKWLRQIPVVEGPGAGSTLDDVQDAVRDAAKDSFASPPESPPFSPSEIFVGSPPISLAIPSGDACEFWQAIFRLWITELRPVWHARFLNQSACCACDENKKEPTQEECLLLAELQVPLAFSTEWQLAGRVSVNQQDRPHLIHLRLLQEWLLCGQCSPGSLAERAVTHPPGLNGYSIVAAGVIKGDGTSVGPTYNGFGGGVLSPPEDGKVMATFNGYIRPGVSGTFHQYIVKVTPMYDEALNKRLKKDVSVALDRFERDGFVLRVTDGSGEPITDMPTSPPGSQFSDLQFMIEVSRYED
jgi:hypothetical protein